jgi:hypothetical protein
MLIPNIHLLIAIPRVSEPDNGYNKICSVCRYIVQLVPCSEKAWKASRHKEIQVSHDSVTATGKE